MGPKGLYEDVEGRLQSLKICGGKMRSNSTPICISAQRSATEINGGKENVFLAYPQQCRSNVDCVQKDINTFQYHANGRGCNENNNNIVPGVLDAEHSSRCSCTKCNSNGHKLLWRKSQYRSSQKNKDQKHGVCRDDEYNDKYLLEKSGDDAQWSYSMGMADYNTREQIVEMYHLSDNIYAENSVKGEQCNDYIAISEHGIRSTRLERKRDSICNTITSSNIDIKCENGNCPRLKHTFGENSIQNPWNSEGLDCGIDYNKSLYGDYMQSMAADTSMAKIEGTDSMVPGDAQAMTQSPEKKLQFVGTPISISDTFKDYVENDQESDVKNDRIILEFEAARQEKLQNIASTEAVNWRERVVTCNAAPSWDYYLPQKYYVMDNFEDLDHYQHETVAKYSSNTNTQSLMLEDTIQQSGNTVSVQEGDYNNSIYQCIPALSDRTSNYNGGIRDSTVAPKANSYTTPPLNFDQMRNPFFVQVNTPDERKQFRGAPVVGPCLNMHNGFIDELANPPKIPRRGRPPSKISIQTRVSPIEAQSRSSAASFSPIRDKHQGIRRISEPTYQYNPNFTIDPVTAEVSKAVQAAIPVGPPNLPSGFKCPFSGCDKVIKYRWGLKAHIWTHCGMYSCCK